jgi:hypothetical protein
MEKLFNSIKRPNLRIMGKKEEVQAKGVVTASTTSSQ